MLYGLFLSLFVLLVPQRLSVLPQAILTEPEPSVASRLKGCLSVKLSPVQVSISRWGPDELIVDFPKVEADLNHLVRARLERMAESIKGRLRVHGVGESAPDSAVLSLSLQERYDREGRMQIDVFLVVRDHATLLRNGEKLLVPVYEAKAFVVKPSGAGVRQVIQDLVDGFARMWVEANRSSS